jgi:membrane protease subunit (stomatin/prohibitin family)
MSDDIRFTRNYKDLCTDTGFQFEFLCDRCNSGYRSKFKASVTGGISKALDAAGSVFGGIFGKASNVGDRVHDATWERAHDKAFQQASRELIDKFIQCPRCNAWVCRENCWNTKRGLCKECAPDLGVEMSAAQANRSVEEVWAHSAMAEEDKKLAKEYWRETIRASCPKCEAPLQANAKFCPECGAALKERVNCPKCGCKLTPDSKFCQECGEKLE